MSIQDPPAPPPPPPVAEAPASGAGVRAVVLYDYEAEEENEMALTEGETIEQIEQIDEGWWSGVGAGGKTGLFPGKTSSFHRLRHCNNILDSKLR